MRRGAAGLVAAGILASRVMGLVRQRVIAHYLGQSTIPADAFAAAFRIPNFLQNLFGEGVLSASLIPEYTRLVARGDEEQARRVAGTVASLLGLVVSLVVTAGVLLAAWLVDVIVPGFEGPRRELAVSLVRILFPGVGLLVLSAWCLGILNSHRRFLLSYMAPVVWNLAIVGATLWGATQHDSGDRIVRWTAWGAVAGSALQLLIQLPLTLRLLGGFRATLQLGNRHVRAVLGNFGPAFVSRGVVQISAFLDAMIASFLPTGAVAALTNSQLLYNLPVSLFGMSVAAAELPELSEAADRPDARTDALRDRLAAGSAQVAFFIVPTALAFLTLGHLIAGLVFQSGAFTQQDSYWVWGTLAGASVGLLPQSLGRLLTSAYFALNDTRTPLRCATIRVSTALALGLPAALLGPRLLGVDAKWGTVGLALGTGIAGGLEYGLLRRYLKRRIGSWPTAAGRWPRLAGSAALATGAGLAVALPLAAAPRAVAGAAAIAAFGAVYLGSTWALGVPEARALSARLGGLSRR